MIDLNKARRGDFFKARGDDILLYLGAFTGWSGGHVLITANGEIFGYHVDGSYEASEKSSLDLVSEVPAAAVENAKTFAIVALVTAANAHLEAGIKELAEDVLKDTVKELETLRAEASSASTEEDPDDAHEL